LSSEIEILNVAQKTIENLNISKKEAQTKIKNLNNKLSELKIQCSTTEQRFLSLQNKYNIIKLDNEK
jgi:peptidoglycan hydrolase CwlO-like protein